MNKGRKLLIRSEGSGWIERESSAFENEVHQQEIFAKNPAQIPGVEVGVRPPRRMRRGPIVSRASLEFGFPAAEVSMKARCSSGRALAQLPVGGGR